MSKKSPLPLVAMIALCVAGVVSSFWPTSAPPDAQASKQQLADDKDSVRPDLARTSSPVPASLDQSTQSVSVEPGPSASAPALLAPENEAPSVEEPALSQVGPLAAIAPLLKASEPENAAEPVKAPTAPKAPSKQEGKPDRPSPSVQSQPGPAKSTQGIAVASVSKPLVQQKETDAARAPLVAPVASQPVRVKPGASSPRVGISPATRAAALAATEGLNESDEGPTPIEASKLQEKPQEPAVPREYAIVGFDANKVWLKVDATRTVVIQKGESVPGLGQFRHADSSGAQFDAGKVTRHVDVQPAN